MQIDNGTNKNDETPMAISTLPEPLWMGKAPHVEARQHMWYGTVWCDMMWL